MSCTIGTLTLYLDVASVIRSIPGRSDRVTKKPCCKQLLGTSTDRTNCTCTHTMKDLPIFCGVPYLRWYSIQSLTIDSKFPVKQVDVHGLQGLANGHNGLAYEPTSIWILQVVPSVHTRPITSEDPGNCKINAIV